MNYITRRDFFKITGITASGFIVGCSTTPKKKVAITSFKPNVFIHIPENGPIELVCHRSEMGQGIKTSLICLMAEELDLLPHQFKVVQADGDEKLYGAQTTGGSSSIVQNYYRLRQLSAATREVFILAAAKKHNVLKEKISYREGKVILPDQTAIPYGDLIDEAKKIPFPSKDVELKKENEQRYLKKPHKLFDIENMLRGKLEYGHDFYRPQMIYVALKRCPAFRGTLLSFDASQALKVKGVINIYKMQGTGFKGKTNDSIVVLSNNSWSALKAKELVKIEWDLGPQGTLNQKDLDSLYMKTLNSTFNKETIHLNSIKNKSALKRKSKTTIIQDFHTPFWVHAPLEAPVCNAIFQNNTLEIWAPTQALGNSVKTISKVTGLPEENITVHFTAIGGAFGRKSMEDWINETALVAKDLCPGKFIQLLWSREDEIQHSFFHPQFSQRIEVKLDKNNRPLSWKHLLVGNTIVSLFEKEPKSFHKGELEGTSWMPFKIPHMQVKSKIIHNPLRIGWVRSVHHIHQGFSIGQMTDLLAKHAKENPIEYYKKLLSNNFKRNDEKINIKRITDVIDKVRKMANFDYKWKNNDPIGFAFFYSYGTYVAAIMELENKNSNKVKNVFCVMDCGLYINPDIVKAQIEGSVVFALSLSKRTMITLKNGCVEQSNFDDYEILRMNEMPNVHVHLMDNQYDPGGVGEPCIPVFMAAYANCLNYDKVERKAILPLTKKFDV